MPGLGKVGNVTMKKGIFVNDQAVRGWRSEITLNTISRRNIVINLLDEESNPKMVWTLNNAWPTKNTGTGRKSKGSEVAVESVETAFETQVVADG